MPDPPCIRADFGAAGQAIIVRLGAAPDHVTLSVENHGQPIPPEKINTVFEPLVRLATDGDDDATADPGSTSLGIGLYIAREIVHAHGGTIAVTSTEQDGTVFAITLPRQPAGNVAQHWPAVPGPAHAT